MHRGIAQGRRPAIAQRAAAKSQPAQPQLLNSTGPWREPGAETISRKES